MNEYKEYQKALSNLSTMGDKDLYNERHLEWIKTLQELVDKEKSPTLEEVKKEWEALGYKVDIANREIEFTHLKSIKYISIDRKSKTYWCPFYLSLEEHQLITKTIRALGWV